MFIEKESKLHNRIRNIAAGFDRDFDNTVVDTFAFDKALHSSELINFLSEKFSTSECYEVLSIHDISRETGNIIINEVKDIYSKTGHKFFNPDVYFNYSDRLVSRIASEISL